MEPFLYKTEVSDDLIDSEYQHVHHANIVRLLERGRLELLKFLGRPIEDFMIKGEFWVLSDLSLSFLREVTRGEVTIFCENMRIVGRTFILEQRIVGAREKDLVRASVNLMLLSRALGRAIPIPGNLLDGI